MIEGILRLMTYFIASDSAEKQIKKKISNKYLRFLLWLIAGMGILFLFDCIAGLIKRTL
ncbi:MULTISPECIES: hypothetical protein [Duncaniella]|jgi:hypothetical protein|uniref:hypothetical protein n=1 Tax=Duncaniella TaxID=2518495 RepID=UPI00143D9D7A|nr:MULTISPECIES: hypothetical protein [Duncaniella]